MSRFVLSTDEEIRPKGSEITMFYLPTDEQIKAQQIVSLKLIRMDVLDEMSNYTDCYDADCDGSFTYLYNYHKELTDRIIILENFE